MMKRYLSKRRRKKELHEDNGWLGFSFNQSKSKKKKKTMFSSVFVCHRHIIGCWICCWCHGIHIPRWNISMLKKKESLSKDRRESLNVLHWEIVRLLVEYQLENKRLYRMMLVMTEEEGFLWKWIHSSRAYWMRRWCWTLWDDVSTSHWNKRHLNIHSIESKFE